MQEFSMHPALSDAAPAFLAILLSLSSGMPTDVRKARRLPPPAVQTVLPAGTVAINVSDAGQGPLAPINPGGRLPLAGATVVIPAANALTFDSAAPTLKGTVARAR
jgi:hypothetical protein